MTVRQASCRPGPLAGQRVPAARPIQVLYIGGWGRSGSTLLDLMLGQAPGVFSAGEVREIWRSGLAENRPCGCGQPFRDCPFWRDVGIAGFGGWDRIQLPEILRLRYSLDRPWSIPLRPPSGLAAGTGWRYERYLGVLRSLYGAIADVSGARVIVDSSNLPSHAFLLRAMPAIDLRVAHLVRDSRGVACSWQSQVEKRRTGGPPAYLPRYGPCGASLRWLLYNGLTHSLKPLGVPYTFVRYEDVISTPGEVTRRLLRHAGLPSDAAEPRWIDGHLVRLGPNHTAEGNPMRFASGTLELRADLRWRQELAFRDRQLVTALTLPLLAAYGYPAYSRNLP